LAAGLGGPAKSPYDPSAALFFSLDFGHIVPGEAARRSLDALNHLEIAKAEQVAHGYGFH